MKMNYNFKNVRNVFAAAIILLLSNVLLEANHASAQSTASVRSDFNGDGFADLAVGVPNEKISGASDAGAVNVLYGSGKGITGNGSQIWHQDKPGMLDGAEASDRFGSALAPGDFDNDGFADLAIGIKFEKINGNQGTGAVSVLYGTTGGLAITDNQFWHPGNSGLPSSGTDFGSALAVADFNADGFDDLAISVPAASVLGVIHADAVCILYGSAAGLIGTGSQFWHQGIDSTGVIGQPRDSFGNALAAGDFNNDSFDDLALGIPSKEVQGIIDAGVVNISYGSASGISALNDQQWHQNQPQIAESAEVNDNFGHSLAVGDFNGDGHDDLAIGVPYEDEEGSGLVVAGGVNVLYGISAGISAVNSQVWHRKSQGLNGKMNASALFGAALSSGDFDNDGFDDLAIGVPRDKVAGVQTAGSVNVLYGMQFGLAAQHNQLWSLNDEAIPGVPKFFDHFGYALASGDFDGNGSDDLAIGIPNRDIRGITDAGAIISLNGSSARLVADSTVLWHQDSENVDNQAEAGDSFGLVLGASATSTGGSSTSASKLAPPLSGEPTGEASQQRRASAESLSKASGIQKAPADYSLEANYPNPFNPQTTIQFALPRQSFVTLKVYNLLGQEVAVLLQKNLEAGIHQFTFDASGLSSGTYICRMQADGFSQVRRMTLMK